MGKMKLKMPKTESPGNAGLNNAGIETYKNSPMLSLTKEEEQNSTDGAQKNEKGYPERVEIEFNDFNLPTSKLPDIDRVREVFEEEKIYWSGILKKDKKTIEVSIINASGNAKELKDCNIGGIEVYASNKNAPEFSIAKGIKVGDKEDKIREAFGSPKDTSNNDGYNTLYYGEDNSTTTITCDNKEDDYSYDAIAIKNFVATEDDKKTETSDEVPEYLSTYVAPTELGTDPLSYNIEIENQVYTLPAPVSAFTDNGWKIASQEDSVPSGQSLSYAIKLQKDGKEIEASVTNFADYQTKPENCAISSLHFYADESKNPEVKLPGGITIKSTSDDLKKWAGDKFDYSKSGDSEYYDYYDDDNEGSIYINCKKTVSSMSVKKETWPSK